ncbi:YIP1 family protein [Kitasatospora sp. NBC_00070]|uniref:Yip1 family protein n=1 Tax=Kitasatospora sp. NBC_00070 TaxID=2975962 RepID=UPI00324640BF
MAGNGYDNGEGAADPRRGWAAAPGGQDAQQYPGGGPVGEPEYFTAPHPGYPPGAPGGPGAPGAPGAYDPDQPGHTRAFTVEDEQYYSAGPGYPGGPDHAGPQGQDNVAVYRAGGQSAPHQGGPRLAWKELLTGIYRAPSATFDRMRDHQVWLPALTVSLAYGVLAVLGIGLTKDEVVNSTFTVALTAIAGAAVGFTLAGVMLGAVTYGLARQLGGDGPWQSTVGLAVIIGWTSDVPRLLLALFLPADNLVVQVLGWVTWLICAVLLTTMVRRVHDLPWGKAAGAAALQLLALLVLIKLPTLG